MPSFLSKAVWSWAIPCTTEFPVFQPYIFPYLSITSKPCLISHPDHHLLCPWAYMGPLPPLPGKGLASVTKSRRSQNGKKRKRKKEKQGPAGQRWVLGYFKHIQNIQHIQQCQIWTAPMIFLKKIVHFWHLKKTGYGRTDGPTDGPTDGHTLI